MKQMAPYLMLQLVTFLKRNIDIVILFGKKYNENVHGILLLDSSEIYKILHISEILIL